MVEEISTVIYKIKFLTYINAVTNIIAYRITTEISRNTTENLPFEGNHFLPYLCRIAVLI
jgi:hypothetical protein